MNLSIQYGTMYANNVFFSYCEAGNGGTSLPVGTYPLEREGSSIHASGLGRIGADATYPVVLGGVRDRAGVVPCRSYETKLSDMLTRATEDNCIISLVVV